MAITHQERIRRLLDQLTAGLGPIVAREFNRAYGDGWADKVAAETEASTGRAVRPNPSDPQFLLNALWFHWDATVGRILGRTEKNYVAELRDTRNRWAHPEKDRPFTGDDVYRAYDTAERLLAALSAPEAAQLQREKLAILREGYEAQAGRAARKSVATSTAGTPQKGLRPWRELVAPHPDVAAGRYNQAEFVADLGQVMRGEGADEYLNPGAFYSRTYLTEGLRLLLAGAMRRLNGAGGEPVIELQTNFGGGKTHSMLALYHLVDPTVRLGDLTGLEEVMAQTSVTDLPAVKRVVLVGQALSPSIPRRRDGFEVRTLWGELAWQLGGAEAYGVLEAADQHGTSPGSDVLRALLREHGPALILIDEWVAYVRQLWTDQTLPAGSFDANLSFAQALTEAVKASDRDLLVASLPASDIEIGGEGGQKALQRLQDTFGRVQAPWRPASAEESFEIVRRRLFEPISPADAAARDEVLQHFSELYGKHAADFPGETKEAAYVRRMERAYPIHPELFDRLFNDWSTLERFQRTRGVLKLMAAVVHALWERQDGALLILPSSVPLDDARVLPQLTQYLEENWVPIVEADVDGPSSRPATLDGENPTFGRYSATRRVARTIFLGSAPTGQVANRGLDVTRVKLGCVQPGETPATFGDALRRLSGQATYLYVDQDRYWYATQPSVNRLAQDRAGQYSTDRVHEELEKRLEKAFLAREGFGRVHVAPRSGADVPDEDEVALVVLAPEHPWAARTAEPRARAAAEAVLSDRGAGARVNRNMLVFLAADETRLGELESGIREFLAWDSIHAESESGSLNLDNFQRNQAVTKRRTADETVVARVPETYHWLLVPEQEDAQGGPVSWRSVKLAGGSGGLAARAARKLEEEGLLLSRFGAPNLRMVLDRYPAMWESGDVNLRELWGWFAAYLYLPRLQNRRVLVGAVQHGLATLLWRTETFAYAAAKADDGTYRGLVAGEAAAVVIDGSSVLVQPAVAEEELASRVSTGGGPDLDYIPPATHDEGTARVSSQRVRRFSGSVTLRDPTRPVPELTSIARDVLAQLGASDAVRLEVEVHITAEHRGDGFDDVTRRNVSENAATLRFRDIDWEEG